MCVLTGASCKSSGTCDNVRMRRLLVFLGLSLVLGTLAAPVYSHGTGLSLEEVVGDYLIDIGYDQELIAGEQILLDFNLYTQRRDGLEEEAEFTGLAFDVIFNSTPVFSRKVPRSSSQTFMTVVFPTSGQYKLHVSFFRGEEKFVETEFSVSVANAMPKQMLSPFAIIEFASYGFAALVAIVAIVGLLVTRSRRKDVS